ncbi:MAG: hypothetical protein ACFFDN_06135 [Candidatus Hodarchaeota archaeon]
MIMNFLQFISLLFRFAFSISAFFLAVMFFLKVARAKVPTFDLYSFLGLGIFALFIGIMEILFIFYYFFIFQFDQEIFSYYALSTFTGYFGMIGFVFFSEKMLGKTKYAFTIFSIISFIYGIVFINNVNDLRLYSTITTPISAIIVFINFTYSLIVKTKGEIRKKMKYSIIISLFMCFFYIMATALGKWFLPLPEELRVIISMVGLIITIFIWGIIFLSFETFTEFGWKEKLKELYIIAPNGGTLFHYSFEKESIKKVHDLISSGLTGFKEVIAEMIQSKQTLKVIDHEDLKILFEYGNYSTLALITYENLRIYHSKLDSLIKQFENLFQDVLSDWKGETEVFRPSKRLIEEIFG